MNSCCPGVVLVAKWLESCCNINYQISHLFPLQFEMLPVINTYVHWGLFLSTFFKFILECFYYHYRIRPNIKNSSENWKPHLQASKCKAFLKAAAAAKSLQSCPTLCDPIEAAHQVPLPLGFSRQEHWSRLPFPSLMHESEKWKCLTHSNPMDCSLPGSSIHGIFQARAREWVAISFSFS